MPVLVVVGVQWGDEGKGKVVDYLTEKADVVVRFQGGNNAGHTLVVEGKRTALQLIPSGILRSGTRCLLASGMVLDPQSLFDECGRLAEVGIDVTPARLGISPEVQLILPYHRAIDQERERALGAVKIGTTGKGIGPAYEDAVARFGIRMADLFDDDHLAKLIERNVSIKNRILANVLDSTIHFEASDILSFLREYAARLKPYVVNVSKEVDRAQRQHKIVVFEGAQGSLLDISHGTYPYVTSSNTVAGYACVSAGMGPKYVDRVVGICKAYCTRVGSGPFPTEDRGEIGERLRAVGKEFGTVTGRPRRCGWFDAAAVRTAIRLNGITELFLTKLDVLSGIPKVKIGLGYRLAASAPSRVQGDAADVLNELPVILTDIEQAEVEYEELDGWTEDLSSVRSFVELPHNAQRLIRRIEELSDCKVSGFSVGPERGQTIVTSRDLAEYTCL